MRIMTTSLSSLKKSALSGGFCVSELFVSGVNRGDAVFDAGHYNRRSRRRNALDSFQIVEEPFKRFCRIRADFQEKVAVACHNVTLHNLRMIRGEFIHCARRADAGEIVRADVDECEQLPAYF